MFGPKREAEETKTRRGKKKMAKNNNMWLFVVVGILAYIVIFTPFEKDAAEPQTPVTQPTTAGSGEACGIASTSFTPSMTDQEKAGTSVTDNFYITTSKLGSQSGTATVPTNFNFDVLYAENSTTYYTKVGSFATGCGGVEVPDITLAKSDTSPNVYVINSDGEKNAAAEEEALGADDEEDLTLTIKASTDAFFGNPDADCRNVVVAEYDKTYVLKMSGQEPAPVPGFFANTQTYYDGDDAWYIEKVGDGDTVTSNFNIETTSTEPTTGMNVTLHIYDCDIDKNEDDLSIIAGIQDEDQNAIDLNDQTELVYIG
jgi:hypothetical protein